VTTVLAALDSGASARPLLSTAIALADLLDATVTCLHVREGVLSAAPELARAAGVELREVSGAPVEQIVAAAQDPDVAALVLGARGVRGGAQPAGHTALEVIERTAKSVAVVPPDAQPSARITRILVPLNGTSETSQALDDVLQLADRHQLEVVALHIYSPTTVPAFADHEPHATIAREQEFLSRYTSIPHDRITLLHRLGVPADHIVAVADETSPDLIVLAWNQNLAPGHAHVVSQTLAHTDIPVLLLPIQQPDAR
jgi:nucleotide-binding universal stress UspA family protein